MRRVATRWLQQAGMRQIDAEVVADILIRADMRGVDTHGVKLLPFNIRRLKLGGANAKAQIEVLRKSQSTALLDGHAGVGQLVAYRATTLGIEMARDSDVAVVIVRNSNHFGAAGAYALLCAEAGFIGCVCTNGPMLMQVTGSRGAAMSSGTRAYGVPSDGPPVVFDASMAVVSGGKIRFAAERGEPIPLGWLVDAEGLPTADPSDYVRGVGARVPIGDHKGYGLALIGELLSGALSGAALASDVGTAPPPEHVPWNIGHVFVVMKVEAFMPLVEFKQRTKSVTDRVRSSPKATGVERIFVPGEAAFEREQTRMKDGIPIDPTTWAALGELEKEIGLPGSLATALR